MAFDWKKITNLMEKLTKITGIKGGRNNTIIKTTLNNKNYIIKILSQSKSGFLKNLREFYFLSLLKKKLIKNVPQPFFCCINKNYSVYEFLSGNKLKKINNKSIKNTVKFLKNIQIIKKNLIIKKNYYLFAVDACKCLNDHLAIVDLKFKNFFFSQKKNKKIPISFIKLLKSAYIKLKSDYKKKYEKILNNKIKSKKLIVSPSDCGFHNVLNYKNKLFFFDFEYSGLDDIKKLICDFVCQPDYQFNNKQIKFTINSFSNIFDLDHSEIIIIYDLIKIYRIKWCLIMLNDYLNLKNFCNNKTIRTKEYLKKNLNNQLLKSKKYFLKYVY